MDTKLTDARKGELLLLAASVLGLVMSARKTVTDWKSRDRLERTRDVVQLTSSALGLVVLARKIRRKRA